MRRILPTTLLVFCALLVFSQQEKKTSIEFNTRTQFYEVNNHYQIKPEVIYHANSGFRIFPEFDIQEQEIDNEDYVILRYPKFQNGIQPIQDSIKRSPGMAIDAIHVELFYYDSTGKFIVNEGKVLAMKRTEFDALDKTLYYSLNWRKKRNYNFSSGVMTIPFKLRPKIDTTEFNLTTDITLGGYFGLTKRISATKRYYITIPATLGLSYINVNNNNTSNLPSENTIGVVPGITWSTGLVFQLEDFNIGFVLGKDYASSVGDKWLYNKKIWYSFAIGYNFLAQK